MALEIKLNQKLSQTLVMTPQLQQAIKLLQLGRMEYLEVIEKELLENPVLEDVAEIDPKSDSDGPSSSQSMTEHATMSPDEIPSNSPNAVESEIDFSAEESSRSPDILDAAFEWYGEGPRGAVGSDRERNAVDAVASSAEGLASHLLWQIRTSDMPQEDQSIAAHIVGNLDRNGYLCASAEEIAELSSASTDEVERVLSIVQTLDPPGIAARDLRECLLAQLDQLGLVDSLPWKIVDTHLVDLELRRYEVIAKAQSVQSEQVYEAIKTIQRLEPRPGRPFVDEAPVYITPDVYVRKVGDEYIVSLNENGVPKLRLNPRYQELLGNLNGKKGEERDYLLDRIRSAAWLIKSIQQRQQTIFKVTQSIVNFQRDFLEHGISALKPLVLREVASDVGMHESTVSRVTTNKYVHTPQGIYELKFFFSTGLRSDGGEISSESVKERIRDLVSNENHKKPLSDQQIVVTLRAEGIDIARRTVAKYREMMNILSSSRRKKLF